MSLFKCDINNKLNVCINSYEVYVILPILLTTAINIRRYIRDINKNKLTLKGYSCSIDEYNKKIINYTKDTSYNYKKDKESNCYQSWYNEINNNKYHLFMTDFNSSDNTYSWTLKIDNDFIHIKTMLDKYNYSHIGLVIGTSTKFKSLKYNKIEIRSKYMKHILDVL